MFVEMRNTKVASNMPRAANLILEHLADSDATSDLMIRRRNIIAFMESFITNCLGLETFSDNSLIDNLSMLPSSIDCFTSSSLIGYNLGRHVNISFSINSEATSPWYLNLCQSLCELSSQTGKNKCDDKTLRDIPEVMVSAANIVVERISYIPAEARLEAVVNKITVQISPNNYCVLGFSTILTEFDRIIPLSNVFQRSLLLVKAWCSFEAESITMIQPATDGCSATITALKIINNEKVVEVLMMWLFSSKLLDGGKPYRILEDEGSIDCRGDDVAAEGDENIQDPFVVLIYFLFFFSRFEWSKWAISATGLIPSSPEVEEEGKENMEIKVTGRLGECNAALTAIVNDCRKSLRTCSDQIGPVGSHPDLTGTQSFQVASTLLLGFDSLPADHKNGEICVLHPLKKGHNLFREKNTFIGTEGCVIPLQKKSVEAVAIKEIFAAGFVRITATIRTLAKQELNSSLANGGDLEGTISNMPMKIVKRCFPMLSKSLKGRESDSFNCVESTFLDSERDSPQMPNPLSTNIVDLMTPTISATDPVSNLLAAHLIPRKADRGRDGDGECIDVTKVLPSSQDPIVRAAALTLHGLASPKGETDSRPPLSAKTILGSIPEEPVDDAAALEGRCGGGGLVGADVSPVVQIRQSLTNHTTAPHGPNQRTETPPLQKGTTPTYIPKSGSFSAKIPTHTIQPFVKKEEHVWVPGKFSTSPQGFNVNSGTGDAYGKTNININDLHFGNNSRDQRGKTQSNILAMGRAGLNGGSPDMNVPGASGSSPTMGCWLGRSGESPPMGWTGTNGGSPQFSRRDSPILNGQGSLGPGIFTNKMVASSLRSTEGKSGNSSPYVSGSSSPYISGSTTNSTQSRSLDSSESQLDERHRANQLALASHHQLLTRQRSAAASLPMHSRVPSGQQPTSQRSPTMPTLLQQRLSQLSQAMPLLPNQPPSHHSRPHSESNSPQLYPPHAQLPISQLNLGSMQPPPPSSYPPSQLQQQSHLPFQGGGYDLDFNGLRNPPKPTGFEAQLPSFLRDL